MSASLSRQATRPQGHRAFIVLALILALVPIATQLGGQAAFLSLATRVIILAIAAVSLDLIVGFAGLVSLGHAAFIGIGAYATGILIKEGVRESLLILPLLIAAAGGFAYLTGKVVLRTRGVGFIMITLAFGQMLFFIVGSLSRYGGDDGLTLWNRARFAGTRFLASDLALYYTALIVLVLAVVFVRAMLAAPIGPVLIAARENETRVSTLGIDVMEARLKAYAVSGIIAALSGFLLANQAEFVSPALIGWQHSAELVMMVVLGGMGTVTGPIFGAIAYGLLEFELSRQTEHWKLIFGPLLIVVVLYVPGGLMGLLDKACQLVKRRPASARTRTADVSS